MELHQGRLIDHVHLKVRDLEASKRFYRAAAEAVGIPLGHEGDGFFTIDEMFFSPGEPLTSGPGERHYHPGYYAAFVLDPDGNNIEAVYHGPSTRSADSVVVKPA